jgi:hypothetical protein
MFSWVFRFILIVCSFIVHKSKVILSIFIYFVAFIYFLTLVLQFFLLIVQFIAFFTAFYLHNQPAHSIFMIFEWTKADFLPLIFNFAEIKSTNDYLYRCYWKIISPHYFNQIFMPTNSFNTSFDFFILHKNVKIMDID